LRKENRKLVVMAVSAGPQLSNRNGSPIERVLIGEQAQLLHPECDCHVLRVGKPVAVSGDKGRAAFETVTSVLSTPASRCGSVGAQSVKPFTRSKVISRIPSTVNRQSVSIPVLENVR
jgi:hypothetical protein